MKIIMFETLKSLFRFYSKIILVTFWLHKNRQSLNSSKLNKTDGYQFNVDRIVISMVKTSLKQKKNCTNARGVEN